MTNAMPRILILTGPTASGKSGLALELAEKTGGVIINADSQQLYRDLPILTARPTPSEEAGASHKLYGILSAEETPSVGKWLKLAKMEIDWALSQGKSPIVVGGTGLYIKALAQGIAAMPDIPPHVRQQAANDYAQMGKEAFAARLREVDPEFFTRLKVYDRQRLIRAWEVWLGSGKALSWWQAQKAEPLYPTEYFKVFRVDIPREELYRRCDARFLKMIEQGAVEEVRALLPTGGGNLNTIIGVPELSAHLRGELTLDQAIAQAQQATRNYAKRQLTWFRHQLKEAIPIDSTQALSKNCHF